MNDNTHLEKVKEFFVWEDENLIKQEKSCSNNTESDNNGIISSTEKKEMPIVCEDTGKTKKNVDKMTDLELLFDTIKWLKRKIYKKKWHDEHYKEYWRIHGSEKIKKKQQYRKIHREQERIRLRELWSNRNPSKILKKKKQKQQYDKTHLRERNLRRRNRYKTDMNYKLSCSIRSRLKKVLTGKTKSGSAIRDLGCSLQEFKKYIESKFQTGMTWNNYGFYGWHLDHITPLAAFNLEDRNQFLVAFHYTNYQPLWARENNLKRDKII